MQDTLPIPLGDESEVKVPRGDKSMKISIIDVQLLKSVDTN